MSRDPHEACIAHWLVDTPPPDAVELAADEELLRALLAALDTIEAFAPEDPDGALDLLEGLAEDALAHTAPARRAALVGEDLGPRAAALLVPFAASAADDAPAGDPRIDALLRGESPMLDPADGPWLAHAIESLAGLIDEVAVDDDAALQAETWLLDPLLDAWGRLDVEPAGSTSAAEVRVGPAIVAAAEGEDLLADEPPLAEPIPVEIPPGLPPLSEPAPPRRGRHLAVVALAAAAVLAALLWPASPPDTPPKPAPIAAESRHGEPPAPAPRRENMPPSVYRPALVHIPAGTSLLGSPADEPGRQADETLREVTLTRPYWMGRTEVTHAQWSALMGNRPAQFTGLLGGGPKHPIEQVSWHDAVAYANALSAAEGLPACYVMSDCEGVPGDRRFTCGTVAFEGLDCAGYRLPTEAEWEHAARAGTRTATYAGPIELRGERDAPVLEDIAWYSGNSGVPVGGVACGDWTERPPGVESTGCATQPVATKRPNPWGLYDMLGNVWEWTHDGHADLSPEPAVDPVVPPARRMVTKGCGWFREARFCRAANRYRPRPDYRTWVLGIRIVRTARD